MIAVGCDDGERRQLHSCTTGTPDNKFRTAPPSPVPQAVCHGHTACSGCSSAVVSVYILAITMASNMSGTTVLAHTPPSPGAIFDDPDRFPVLGRARHHMPGLGRSKLAAVSHSLLLRVRAKWCRAVMRRLRWWVAHTS